MNFMRLGLVSLAALAFAPLAQAQGAQSADETRLRPKWEALDANKDGKVTLDELHPIQAATMKRSDIDGDGAISLAEYVDYDLDPGGAGASPWRPTSGWPPTSPMPARPIRASASTSMCRSGPASAAPCPSSPMSMAGRGWSAARSWPVRR